MFRMNIARIEARIETLKRNRAECRCNGPDCTDLRNDMTILIGVYEKLKEDFLEAMRATQKIVDKLQRPDKPKCKQT